jgi:hypothetical protein
MLHEGDCQKNMTWKEFVQVARVRAVEETDRDGQIWSDDALRAVTQEVVRKGDVGVGQLLVRRAKLLAGRALQPGWGSRLTPPSLPRWLVTTGWIIAFLVGWWLAALGQESEINLLSLPLIGIIVWNLIVVLLSLLPVSKSTAPAWTQKLVSKIDRLPVEADPASTPAGIGLQRFLALTSAPALRRFYLRFRAWFHIGAALLALGSVSGMYARGWSKEYRAVWESTLLNERGAQEFFSLLFAPASAVTGNPIPLEQLPQMHRRAGAAAPAPGEALPWIHLYAATLGLLVVAPRALLVLLERFRTTRISDVEINSSDWQAYAHRLRSVVPGAGAGAIVLTHGLAHDASARNRWRQLAHQQWRDVGDIDYHSVPVGAEADFVATLPPTGARCLLVFNMAFVPEEEVQRWLVEALLNRMKNDKSSPVFLSVALDDADLRKRWSGFADGEKRLADKAQSWRSVMQGLNVNWV